MSKAVVLALACSGAVFAVLGHNAAEAAQCEKQGHGDSSTLLQSKISKHAVKEQSLLENTASSLLGILQGATGKEKVELVLADYDEDYEWSKAYAHIRTIYCKGQKRKNDSKTNGCVPLPNVGREGHTFLHHIVENYDKLSEWTVFTQSGVPTQGYKGHKGGGGHMLPGVSFDSYLLDEEAGGLPRDDGAAFVFTGAVDMKTLNHSLRFSYLHATEQPNLHPHGECPKTELLDGWQRWWDLGWFKKWIGGKCGVKADELPAYFNKYWDEYVKSPRPENEILFFVQGARFAASRERIQQRPKEDYQRMLELLSHDKDPCQNYLNEWIWYYAIGKPTEQPCSTSLLIFEGNQNARWMGSASFAEAVEAGSVPRA